MPILIEEHAHLRMHRITLHGRVTFSELYNLLAVHKINRDWAAADTIHIVDGAADLSDLTAGALDALRSEYRALQQSIDFLIVRRVLWVCSSTECWRLAEYWLQDRHWRDGQGTEPLLVSSLSDARDLFGADELGAAQAETGWIERARIDHQARVSAA